MSSNFFHSVQPGEPLFPYEVGQAVTESVPIIVVDAASQTVTFTNQWADKMFGYPRFGLIGRHVNELMDPEHREAHVAYFREYMKSPQPRTMRAPVNGLRKDGSRFKLSAFLLPVAWKGTDLVVAILTPVSSAQQES